MTRAMHKLVALPNPDNVWKNVWPFFERLGLKFFALFLKLLQPVTVLGTGLKCPLQEVD